jgi:hypothetical protein
VAFYSWMMKHVLLAGSLLLAVPSLAAADCATKRDPKITVTVQEQPIAQDQAFSRHALSERVGGVAPGWQAFGLTEASHETEIHYGFKVKETGKTTCATLTSVTVTITLRLVVHLASELKRGSCAYQAVSEHEQQHVDLERKSLPLARTRVEKALTGIAKRGFTAASFDASTAGLEQQASRVIEDALDAFAAQKNRGHAAFDTPEEYTKLTHRCPDREIRALLTQ